MFEFSRTSKINEMINVGVRDEQVADFCHIARRQSGQRTTIEKDRFTTVGDPDIKGRVTSRAVNEM